MFDIFWTYLFLFPLCVKSVSTRVLVLLSPRCHVVSLQTHQTTLNHPFTYPVLSYFTNDSVRGVFLNLY